VTVSTEEQRLTMCTMNHTRRNKCDLTEQIVRPIKPISVTDILKGAILVSA